jgi:hypothetical protein
MNLYVYSAFIKFRIRSIGCERTLGDSKSRRGSTSSAVCAYCLAMPNKLQFRGTVSQGSGPEFGQGIRSRAKTRYERAKNTY